MAKAQISGIDLYLPDTVLGNEELARLYSGWTPQTIQQKLGVRTRRIAAEGQTAGDLAALAAEKLFLRGVCTPSEIEFVILCTQAPDYFLPSTACLLQDRLGVPKTAGAFDFNLGCSGYVYGLAMAKGLIETGMAGNVLLLTSDTYSKYINPMDRGSRPLFGDGAAATLIRAVEGDPDAEPLIGPFLFGTDGSGGDLLSVPAGAHREPSTAATAVEQTDSRGAVRSRDQLFMHGPGIFSFAISTVPKLVDDLLAKGSCSRDDVDLFVFHQANKFMLEALRAECQLDPDRFVIDMADRGNTVSSTIPIAIRDTYDAGSQKPDARVMMVGFGVGLSWAGALAVLPETI